MTVTPLAAAIAMWAVFCIAFFIGFTTGVRMTVGKWQVLLRESMKNTTAAMKNYDDLVEQNRRGRE